MLRRVLLIVLVALQLTAGVPVSLAETPETTDTHGTTGTHATTDTHRTTGAHMAGMDMTGMDMTGTHRAGMDVTGMAGMDMTATDVSGMEMSHCADRAQHQHSGSKHGCCSDGGCQCAAPAALPAATPPVICRVRPSHMRPESDIRTRALRIDLFLRPPIP